MRLVEEEHELRLRQIAHLGQLFEELRHEPQQEGRVHPGRLHEPVGDKDVDHPPASRVGLHEIVDVQGGFAEEPVAALFPDDQQVALDRADAGLRDVSVLDLELVRVVPHVLGHGPEILEVEKQQAAVVGDLEDNVEDARLGLVQVEDAGKKQRPHLGDRRPDRVPLFAENVPEHNRIALVGEPLEFQIPHAVSDPGVVAPRLGQPREIPLHIGHENRHSQVAELLCQHSQGNRFPGAGGAGDQAVTVGHLRVQENVLRASGDENR